MPKDWFKKLEHCSENLKGALLEWRCTPRADGYSPAEAFFKRRPRMSLPAINKTNDHDTEKFRATRHSTHKIQDLDGSRGTQKLSTLHIDDDVTVRNPFSKLWDIKGTITGIHPKGRSYIILDSDGKTIRRNRRFVKLTKLIPETRPSNDDPQVPPDDGIELQKPRRSARIANRNGGQGK